MTLTKKFQELSVNLDLNSILRHTTLNWEFDVLLRLKPIIKSCYLNLIHISSLQKLVIRF